MSLIPFPDLLSCFYGHLRITHYRFLLSLVSLCLPMDLFKTLYTLCTMCLDSVYKEQNALYARALHCLQTVIHSHTLPIVCILLCVLNLRAFTLFKFYSVIYLVFINLNFGNFLRIFTYNPNSVPQSDLCYSINIQNTY